MGDVPGQPCLAIVPSRARPGQLGELIGEFAAKSWCSDLLVCLDDDDPAADEYREMLRYMATRGPAGVRAGVRVGPRKGLTAWTNEIAAEFAGRYEALITLGDDHRPVTEGWDLMLRGAAQQMGGGWAYGDDGLQHENLPTAFLVSSSIVRALGWMLLDGCAHMFVDAAARDLADACGRRAYLPDVHVKHLHYTSGLSPYDQTYADGYASWPSDEETYRRWLGDPPGTGQIAQDAQTVRRALERA